MHRQQRGQLIASPGRISRIADVVGEVAAVGQGVGVLGPQDPLAHRHQRGQFIPRGGHIPGLPDPAGEFLPDGQGFGVFRAGYAPADLQ